MSDPEKEVANFLKGAKPDTTGIEPTPQMIECLRCIIWAEQNDPSEAEVFWEDLGILISGLPDKRTTN